MVPSKCPYLPSPPHLLCSLLPPPGLKPLLTLHSPHPTLPSCIHVFRASILGMPIVALTGSAALSVFPALLLEMENEAEEDGPAGMGLVCRTPM